MQSLPMDSFLPEVMDALRRRRAVVVVAEPGAGKTTRVPPGIIRAGILGREHPNLVLLQPRRVAARAAAARIADENGWDLGREVGYQIRFERRMTPETRLRVLTEGILNRRIVDDPSLAGVGAVVLDEFHERSLHTDLAIAMLKEVRSSLREDLMLVVMSATLETGPVARFLGDCPIVRVPGRTFPIEIEHRPPRNVLTTWTVGAEIARVLEEELTAEDAEARGGSWSNLKSEISNSKSQISKVKSEFTPRSSASSAVNLSGDALVFLPGADEIRRSARELGPMAGRNGWLVLPLHGSLPADQQVRALAPAPPGKRKIILATNIAETSLTMDGVTIVIDSGLARMPMHDAQRGLDRLDLVRISKASATQRAGRAGRTRPGRCVRLWSAKQQQELRDFDEPEIRRVDLAQSILALGEFGYADPYKLPWFDPPPHATVAAAQRLLFLLGAVEGEAGGRITALGRRMLSLPVHPRLARLLIAAGEVGMLEQGAALAAILSEKDFVVDPAGGVPRHLRRPTISGESDLLPRLEALDSGVGVQGSENVDSVVLDQVRRTRDQLLRLASHAGGPVSPHRAGEDEAALRRILLAAYPDRVVKRRENDPAAGLMVGGVGVRLAAESVVRRHELYLAIDLRFDQRAERREAMVRLASEIEEGWLAEMFPSAVRREAQTVFDPARQRVVGRVRTLYHDLPLSQQDDAPVPAEEAGQVLADALRPLAARIITADESAAGLLARVAFARRFMPEHPWPEFTGDALSEVLASACRSRRAVDQIRPGDLEAAIREQLPYPLDRILDEHAPAAIAVPTGNHIRLDYSGERPTLAVRLQELFGLPSTPRIAKGRIPVVLHLLGPNHRPVQVTDDLASFWVNTYPRVRKDLRARYPKHSWPDNPLDAQPTAKAKRKRRKD